MENSTKANNICGLANLPTFRLTPSPLRSEAKKREYGFQAF